MTQKDFVDTDESVVARKDKMNQSNVKSDKSRMNEAESNFWLPYRGVSNKTNPLPKTFNDTCKDEERSEKYGSF